MLVPCFFFLFINDTYLSQVFLCFNIKYLSHDLFSFSYLSLINMRLILFMYLWKNTSPLFFIFISDKYLSRTFLLSMISIYLVFIIFINENHLSHDFYTNDEFLCFAFLIFFSNKISSYASFQQYFSVDVGSGGAIGDLFTASPPPRSLLGLC